MSDDASQRIFDKLESIDAKLTETNTVLFGARNQGGLLRDVEEIKKKSSGMTAFFGRCSAESSSSICS